MLLTANFDRDEFGNVPPEYEGNVVALATTLQAFRTLAGVPFYITKPGGVYRSPEHNATVPGASATSQHLQARAADGTFVGITNRELARRVMAAMKAGKFPQFGQMILYDYDTHTHISLPRTGKPNNQILYARKGANGKPVYTPITQAADVPAVSRAAIQGGAVVGVMLASLALSYFLPGGN